MPSSLCLSDVVQDPSIWYGVLCIRNVSSHLNKSNSDNPSEACPDLDNLLQACFQACLISDSICYQVEILAATVVGRPVELVPLLGDKEQDLGNLSFQGQ